MPASSFAQLVDQFERDSRCARPSAVHAEEHLGPVARLGAAAAGLDREESVGGVLRAGEHRPQLEVAEASSRAGELLSPVGLEARVFLGQLAQRLEVADRFASSSNGLIRPLRGLSWGMICWAFSGLSQKFGCSIARSACRVARFLAMSKRPPQLGQTADEIFGSAAEVGELMSDPFLEKCVLDSCVWPETFRLSKTFVAEDNEGRAIPGLGRHGKSPARSCCHRRRQRHRPGDGPALSREGAKVAIAGRNRKSSTTPRRALRQPDSLEPRADIADRRHRHRRSSSRRSACFGQIDILVNNAGTNLKERTFRELTPESWEQRSCDQPRWRVLLHPLAVPGDDRAQGWRHHQHQLRRR